MRERGKLGHAALNDVANRKKALERVCLVDKKQIWGLF